jgi:phosphate transport system substrate-binding protein
MRKNSRKIFLMAIMAMMVILTGCQTKNRNHQSVTVVGSTALQPLVEKAAADYQVKTNDVDITVQGGGSGTGLSQVQQGAVSIGNSDVYAEQQEGINAKRLVDHRVAVVGMAPIVNRDVPIKNISMTDLQKIFTGKIINWKTLGGPDQKIVVINRAQGSGIRNSFERVVLKQKPALNAQEQDSNGTVQKIIEATPGSISYLSFSYFNDQVKPLAIDNVQPTAKNVQTDHWKIWSYEHMYTQPNANRATKAFLKYMTSKTVQKNLITDLGYISIHDMKVELTADDRVIPIKEGDS